MFNRKGAVFLLDNLVAASGDYATIGRIDSNNTLDSP